MPNDINALPSQHFSTLSTPFGDSPLGRLGTVNVIAKTPLGARARCERFADQVKSLARRTALELAPATVRANAEVRAATKAFSAHLGDVLGALSLVDAGLPSEEDVSKALTALLCDAQGLVRHGLSFEEALNKRLELHLGQLDQTLLAAVAKGARSESVATILVEHQAHPKAAETLCIIANRAAAQLSQQVERDIRDHLLTGMADLMAQDSANTPDQFTEKYLAMTENVVAGLTSLEKAGVASFPDGVSGAARKHIDEAIAQLPDTNRARLSAAIDALGPQQKAAQAGFQQAITAFATASKTGNLGDILDHAEAARQALNTLSRTHQVIENTCSNAEQMATFRQSCVNDAIAELPQEDRKAIAEFFAQPDARGLANVCSDLGAGQALADRDPALAKRLNGMSTTLTIIARAAGSPIPERAPVPTATRPGSDLSPEASAAIFGHFSIVVGKGGLPCPLPTRLAQQFADKFQRSIPNNNSQEDPQFNHWFVIDIPRAIYVIDGATMQKKDKASTKAALLKLAGSAEMAMKASQIANQVLLRRVTDMATTDGLILLPDGRSVHPAGGSAGTTKMSFELKKNPAGEIVITGRNDFTDLNWVNDRNQEYIDVAPGAEIHYSVEITLLADGTPRISRMPEIQISALAAI